MSDAVTIPGLARPAGGFGAMMIDPPWRFELFSQAGEEKSAQAQYECMSMRDICAMPVSAYAATDCALFCWATWPLLPDALVAIAAWGFTYKTALPWVKRTVHGKVAFGTGYIVRGCTEPLLIATRGKPSPRDRSVRGLVDAEAGRHSEKPDAAYALVERLYRGPYAEIFSRRPRDGWHCWGNEIAPEMRFAAPADVDRSMPLLDYPGDLFVSADPNKPDEEETPE